MELQTNRKIVQFTTCKLKSHSLLTLALFYYILELILKL